MSADPSAELHAHAPPDLAHVTPAVAPSRSPWQWVPSLYFAEGLPYIVAITVSVVMYKRLGVSNSDIALYTSWLYLPWVVKPLWSPLVELRSTKRTWTLTMQFSMAAALGAVAMALGAPAFFPLTLAVLWALAFASATHDIACDGFYLLALPERQAAAFVGVRSTFYRIAMVTGQGAFVVLAGELEVRFGGDSRRAWAITFAALAALLALLAAWHRFILPRPAGDAAIDLRAQGTGRADAARERAALFVRVFVTFFAKPRIVPAMAFLLFFRFAEAQLVKLVAPFLLDARSDGGLGLTTSQVGVAYGTVGVVALTTGGLLGGYLASRYGLRRLLWIFVAAIHLPDAIFVWLAYAQPTNLWLINSAVGVEQFGYGFGFTAYTLFMIVLAEGQQKAAHYAMATGIMALGMMVPGMFAGAVQEHLGYQHFFLWVLLATIPGFAVAALVRVDPEYGRRSA